MFFRIAKLKWGIDQIFLYNNDIWFSRIEILTIKAILYLELNVKRIFPKKYKIKLI